MSVVADEGQKRTLYPLELEWQVVLRLPYGNWEPNLGSLQDQQMLLVASATQKSHC